jgi:predicted GH43/DUF377 family glycosyl hydrolase
MLRSLRRALRAVCPLPIALLAIALGPAPAAALLYIDFEQPYYVHDGMQVWDHCIVEDGGVYHFFYHGIPESATGAQNAHDIFLATSTDLIHWSAPTPVVSISEEPHEAEAVWAPDVVFDEETGLWWMSYTGVDFDRNQRICMAWSRDLVTWFKTRLNPVLEPDPETFVYFPEYGWAECRDPYLYREDGSWSMLVTATADVGNGSQGSIARATSTDLLSWSLPEVFFLNDDDTYGNALESPQFVLNDGVHHLFFHQYSTIGITHVAALDPNEWSMNDANLIDLGIAPEVETFDGGEHHIFTRIGPYQEPDRPNLSYVARIDTLRFQDGVDYPQVYRAPPLERWFPVRSGLAQLGNPTFGDNPARRGEDPAEPVGYWYYGSAEYFQGPLSGRGDPGRPLGNSAQGRIETAPFVIQGASISMRVGGTDSPDCYVALVDAEADTVLRIAHGLGIGTMTERIWDVIELQGRSVYLRIEDADVEGHINVDHIVESFDVTTGTGDAPSRPASLVTDLGPSPNPFNPATSIRLELAEAAPLRVSIHDLRGRLVWDSGTLAGRLGRNTIRWDGMDRSGAAVPAGVYVYGVEAAGRVQATGKLTLIP